MELVTAYYNIRIKEALDIFNAGLMLLCECGEAGEGLGRKRWVPMLERICGDRYEIYVHGCYTTIVKLQTVEFTKEPSLRGPFRMCQYMQVIVKGIAGKPINVFNRHSTSSPKGRLPPAVREHILFWFADRISPQALLGGDLDSSPHTLNAGLGDENMKYCCQPDHRHGEIVVAKCLEAWSVPCEACSTMAVVMVMVLVIVMVMVKSSGSAAKPALKADVTATAAPANPGLDPARLR